MTATRSAPTSLSTPTSAARTVVIEAVQAALAAEHAAVYGYGVVGARLVGNQRDAAHAALASHHAYRDSLVRTLRDLGATPAAAAPAYELPFPVSDPVTAERLGSVLEEGVAAVYADLVQAGTGELRRTATAALRESALRAIHWRGSSVPFPGLPELSATEASPTPSHRPNHEPGET